MANALIQIQDQQPLGTPGSAAISGWQMRRLNALVVDTGGNCSLSGNKFTLQPGTYRFRISAPAVFVNQHLIRLADDFGAVLVFGTNEYANQGNIVQTRSFLECRLSLAVATALHVDHYCNTGNGSSSALGVPASIGSEIYTTVWIEKE